MAFFDTKGQQARGPLLLPSRAQLDAPYIQAMMQKLSMNSQERQNNATLQARLAEAINTDAFNRQKLSVDTQQADKDRAAQQSYNMAQIGIMRDNYNLQKRKQTVDENIALGEYQTKQAEARRRKEIGTKMGAALKAGDYNEYLNQAAELDPEQAIKATQSVASIAKNSVSSNKETRDSLPIVIAGIESSANPQEAYMRARPTLLAVDPNAPETYNPDYINNVKMATNTKFVDQMAKEGAKKVTANTEKMDDYNKYLPAYDRINSQIDELTVQAGPSILAKSSQELAKQLGGDQATRLQVIKADVMQLALVTLKAFTGAKSDFELQKSLESVPNPENMTLSAVKQVLDIQKQAMQIAQERTMMQTQWIEEHGGMDMAGFEAVYKQSNTFKKSQELAQKIKDQYGAKKQQDVTNQPIDKIPTDVLMQEYNRLMGNQ